MGDWSPMSPIVSPAWAPMMCLMCCDLWGLMFYITIIYRVISPLTQASDPLCLLHQQNLNRRTHRRFQKSLSNLVSSAAVGRTWLIQRLCHSIAALNTTWYHPHGLRWSAVVSNIILFWSHFKGQCQNKMGTYCTRVILSLKFF